MKQTRKQKLRKKDVRRRDAEELKFAIVERLLQMLGVKALIPPIEGATRRGFVERINPRMEVQVSEGSKNDALVARIRLECEKVLDKPMGISLAGREVEVALSDLHRGYHTVLDFLNGAHQHITDPRRNFPGSLIALIDEAIKKVREFERDHRSETFGRLVYQLNDIADQHLKIDDQVIWYRLEPNRNFPERLAFRVVLGRQKQLPVFLPGSDGQRKAYPCLGTLVTHSPQQITWNPARLGIAEADRELPVFATTHAINHLEERLPVPPNLWLVHRLMRDAVETPILSPLEGTDKFLVEASTTKGKLGYFVAEVHREFILVRTFLFLTMRGTPEARLLRQTLGLSRWDIEYYKLDNFFTLAYSDVGEDPDLKLALARCGCAHLLDFVKPEERVSWLKRHRKRFRAEIGLSPGDQDAGRDTPTQAGKTAVEDLIAAMGEALKKSQGWIV